MGPRPFDWSARPPLRAEHGYALLVSVYRGEDRQSLLYDAGLGRDTVLHNMDVLEVRPGERRAVVVSHGHADQPETATVPAGCRRHSSRPSEGRP